MPNSSPNALFDRRQALKMAGALPVAAALSGLPTHNAFAADARAGTRSARLARGIQLTFLYEDYTPEAGGMASRYTAAIRDTDLQRLQALGFSYIRLSVSPAWILGRYGIVPIQKEKMLSDIRRFIARAHRHHIAVMLTCMTDNLFKAETLRAPDPGQKIVSDLDEFWSTMVPVVAGANPDLLFLEPMNEPNLPFSTWVTAQDQILQLLRSRYPEHTLIATSSNYSGAAELTQMQPVADTNVVYVFHFYEPFVFVCQGSPIPDVQALSNVAYPSNPAQRNAILQLVAGNAGATHLVSQYFDRPWNAQRMHEELSKLSQWAQRHGVIIHAGEIGANQSKENGEPVTDWDSRIRCFTDLRTSLESLGIGWSLYGYQDPWGLCTNYPPTPERVIDPRIISALGLAQETSPPTRKAGGWNVRASPQNGWWWNPREAGVGMGLEMHDMRYFCVMFMYDTNGAPSWYITSGEAESWLPTPHRSDILQTATASFLSQSVGGTPFSGSFRPVSGTNDNISYFNFEATASQEGRLRWIAPEQTLTRFEFGGPGAIVAGPVSSAPESGWWWDSTQPGWGCFLEFQGDLVYMAIFTYTDTGRPEWYSGTGRITNGLLNIALARYRNGLSLSRAGFGAVMDKSMGTFSVQFSSTTEGTYRFPSGSTGRFSRFAF